jgi:hypothetical protein
MVADGADPASFHIEETSTMERFENLLEPTRNFLLQAGAFLPRLLLAVLVVIVGWLLAKAARFALTKALRAINFNVLTQRAGLDGFLRQGGSQGDTTSLFGFLVYWLVILAALLVAANSMGMTYIADLLGRVVWFLPNVFVALVVLALGSYFARFVGDTVTSYLRNLKLRDAQLVGKVVQYAIMVFVILVALDQVRIGGDIVRQSFLMILGGIVFALALAFGLGGRHWAADRIEQWWPSDRKDRDIADRKPPAP